MTTPHFDYVIVGGGLAGASAIEGIREHDQHGSILLIGIPVPHSRDRGSIVEILHTI